MGKLEGKIAIVTGSGKGIGRDAALAIAAEGATVVTVARTQSDLDETVKMIEDAGGTAISLSRDLTDGEQVADMVKTVVDKYGRIDILVNNAGGYPKEIYKTRKRRYRKCIFKNGSYCISDGCIRCCKRRYRNHDQDNCYPDQRIRNQMQCRISWNRGHTGAESLQPLCRTGRLPDGKLKRCCKSNHLPAGRFTGSYDRTVYRPVHNSIEPNDYKRHCHHWQCLL